VGGTCLISDRVGEMIDPTTTQWAHAAAESII